MTRSDFAEAYKEGYTSTVRFLLYTGVPADKADELAQAGWARGWERREQLDEPGKIVSWINRISLNLFRNRLRRQRPTEEITDVPCRAGSSPVTIDVQAGLAQCSADDAELLQAYYVEGFTSSELGRRKRCSPEAIRVRVLRAKRRFISCLRQHGAGRRVYAN